MRLEVGRGAFAKSATRAGIASSVGYVRLMLMPPCPDPAVGDQTTCRLFLVHVHLKVEEGVQPRIVGYCG